MTKLLLVGLLIGVSAAAALTLSTAAVAQTPGIAQLIATVDTERLRSHVDAIDEPRNAFAQPERLAQAGAYIESQFESFGYDVTREVVTAGSVTSQNIYAELAGKACPERTFIVGAHYDSVAESPGADDNASGTGAVLEIARVLSEAPLAATVRFTSFTMEEDGLIGSRAMANGLANANAEIVGVISFDMAAYTAGDGNFLVALGNTASVRQTDSVHRTASYLPDFTIVVVNVEGNGEQQPDSRRSDHAPFWDAGYQGMIVTDTANLRNPNYHQPSDTIDTLDFDFMANSTKAMLATTVDYLTYDGDNDGEADVCSGPLAATPTPTGMPTEPSLTVEGARTPTPTSPPALPPTGTPAENGHGWPPYFGCWLAAAAALLIGAAAVPLRLRR